MDTENRTSEPTIIHSDSAAQQESPAAAQLASETPCAAADTRLAFGSVSAVLMAVFTLFSYPYRAIRQLFEKEKKVAEPIVMPEIACTLPVEQVFHKPDKTPETHTITVVIPDMIAAYEASQRDAMLDAARKALLELDISKTAAH